MISPRRILCSGLWFAAVLICLSSAALAGNVTAQLNNPPSNNILDSIYVGPYNGNNLSGGGSMQMICDDFKDDSDYNQATYTTHSLSNLTGTLWGGLQNAAVLYQEAGWLAAGMMTKTGAVQGYYSFALWAIFDPTDVLNWLKTAGDNSACNYVFGATCANVNLSSPAVGSLLYNAEQSYNYGSLNYSNMLILTPTCNGPHCEEQEFLVFTTPEGGSALLYLLLAGLACLGAVWQSRRRAPAVA